MARELLEQRAGELGVVVHYQHVEGPVKGVEPHREDAPCGVRRRVGRVRWHRVDLAAEVVDVRLHLVEAQHRHREAQQPFRSRSRRLGEREEGLGGDRARRAGGRGPP